MVGTIGMIPEYYSVLSPSHAGSSKTVLTRLPIQCGLLELMLFELERVYVSQPYLEKLYKAILVLGYYGLKRISELVWSDHVLKVCNINIARNKHKILIMLYTSKTHGLESKLQKIKIVANNDEKTGSYKYRNFCPIGVVHDFLLTRNRGFINEQEPFFIFSNDSPVLQSHLRSIIKLLLSNLGLDSSNYGVHSLRIGRTSDLAKSNYSIDEIRRMGRWRSNVVFKYIRQ